MNTHIIIRRIPGIDTEVGAEVDASEWRNAPLLVKQRYLKPLDAVADPDGQTESSLSFDRRVIKALKKEILEGDGELVTILREKLSFAPEAAQASRRRTSHSTNQS